MMPGGGREGLPGGPNIILRHTEVFDTDHDGSLSREEFEAGARAVFDRLDANHDGKIDQTEITRDLSDLFIQPSTRSRRLLRQYDQDHDGKISPEECLLPPKAFAELDANKSGALESDDLMKLTLTNAALLDDPARRAEALLGELDKNGDKKISAEEFPFEKSVFQKADRDGDGSLDADELKALPPLPLDHPQRRAEEMIARMDRDGDRMLSQDEFRLPGARFEDVDQNRDGLLDLKELTAWLGSGNARFGPSSPEEMADRILDRYDRNGDGKITKDEQQGMPDALWQRWDLNADGVVDVRELEQVFGSMRGGPGPAMRGPGAGGVPRGELMRRSPAEIVKALDQDGDGKLTAEELGVDARLFQRIDRDGDSKVTVEELAAAQDLLRTRGTEIHDKVRDHIRPGRPNEPMRPGLNK
jgi:Ca2+-binding EF-hand superfamily protein